MRRSDRKQQGLAILTVLLIVALMVTLLGFLVEQQHLLIRRISNQNVAEQGYQYAQGVNSWGARVLFDDQNRQVDYLGEDWAKFGKSGESEEVNEDSFSLDLSSQEKEQPLPIVDFDFDGLEYEIIDLNSRYNLNNLAVREPNVLNQQKVIYMNLLELAGIEELGIRDQLYGALIDWLDENDLANANGVESGTYQVKSTPYYASDQKLSSLGELRFVEGYTIDIINKIKPYVTVLPIENAKLNINTVSAEVLSSISQAPVSDIGPVIAFLSTREQEAFLGFSAGDIEAAKTAIIGVNAVAALPANNMMQVNSQFFQINTKVLLGDFQFCMKTVMMRGNASADSNSSNKVTELSREYDTLCNDGPAV